MFAANSCRCLPSVIVCWYSWLIGHLLKAIYLWPVDKLSALPIFNTSFPWFGNISWSFYISLVFAPFGQHFPWRSQKRFLQWEGEVKTTHNNTKVSFLEVSCKNNAQICQFWFLIAFYFSILPLAPASFYNSLFFLTNIL